ncbi:glycosyltransferase [Myxacorys almedinensis]|uniref:Glycosyltransferase n=1 Tax=Myxacorys almedinensis A TaxID=2690445 RepID=A0A8J7Z6D1_9CYAN|nr:glycosyltransferase [Myxacorys almedinensis]NDJ18731.1 glycosyltransferase [Myxacorys almedinensis A]
MPLLDQGVDSTIQTASDRCIVVFDLASSGHHPVYIQHLVSHWRQNHLPGTLQIVVSPEFINRHPKVVSLALETAQSQIQFTAITAEEYAHYQSQTSLISRSFAEWNLFCRYASQLQATYGLLMYFDSLQVPLLLGKKPPCPVGGIYFRPTFHYSEFANYKPAHTDRIRQWRQKLLLRLILRKPEVDTLFCLDPFVVKQIEQFGEPVRVVPLADPVQLHMCDRTVAEQLRQELGIGRDRTVFLMLGELSARKGMHQVFEAISALPSAARQRVCLVLAGAICVSERAEIEAGIQQVSQSATQIIVCDRYIREPQPFFEMADVVLAPYQRHVGMSSILVHAAAVQKPVIASDFGLMGELVRRYQLGLAVDAEKPGAIAQSILEALDGLDRQCDRQKMEHFVNQNLAENFVKTLSDQLLNQTQTR